MGHNISALIAKAPIDVDAAKRFDLPVFVRNGFAIVALHPEHCDHWTAALGLPNDSFSKMLLDCPVTREFAKALGMTRYALIETDYAGGLGTQLAAVYQGSQLEMAPTPDGINAALRMIGVTRAASDDEFDTIGLGRHRDFDELFKKYWQR
jgi:hypothetical protein